MVPVFIQQHLKESLIVVNAVFVVLLLLWGLYRRGSVPGVRAPMSAILAILVAMVVYVAFSAFLIGALASKV